MNKWQSKSSTLRVAGLISAIGLSTFACDSASPPHTVDSSPHVSPIKQTTPETKTESSPSIVKGMADSQSGISRYRKFDRNGEAVTAASAKFACVLDETTGLMWEIKIDNDTNSPRHFSQRFRWGGRGAEAAEVSHTSSDNPDPLVGRFYPDWNALLDAVNTSELCGYDDWRVPHIDALRSLVDETQADIKIDPDYFPHAAKGIYWSASAFERYPEHAQTINFADGKNYYYNGFRGDKAYVRLVRGSMKKNVESQ